MPLRPGERNLRAWQVGVLVLVLLAWHVLSRNDQTAFFLLGELVEAGSTDRIFTAPRDRRTSDYIEGRYG